MQIPMPAPDPNILIPQIIPIFGMMTGIVIVGFVVLGPVGRAIGDVVRHLFGAQRHSAALAAGDLDELRGQLDRVGHQLAELAERQDFAERMLAQVRRERALSGAADAVRPNSG
jgi:hypothetical protein